MAPAVETHPAIVLIVRHSESSRHHVIAGQLGKWVGCVCLNLRDFPGLLVGQGEHPLGANLFPPGQIQIMPHGGPFSQISPSAANS